MQTENEAVNVFKERVRKFGAGLLDVLLEDGKCLGFEMKCNQKLGDGTVIDTWTVVSIWR
jgi:hypothetical protein